MYKYDCAYYRCFSPSMCDGGKSKVYNERWCFGLCCLILWSKLGLASIFYKHGPISRGEAMGNNKSQVDVHFLSW